MRKETKAHIDNIVDTMTGADGGVKFTYFKAAIESLDSQAIAGDKAAQNIIYVLAQFSDLLDAIAKISLGDRA